MQIKSVQLDSVNTKAGPDDGLEEGEFFVYPSTFTKEPDAYGDVVAPGAFKKTIQEWKDSGNTLPGLYGHRFDDPDYFVASATDMGEDEHGWWVKGKFDFESPKAKQVYRLVKGKNLSQLSFAFDVHQSGEVELADGRKANQLEEVKVYEFSFVPVGANQDTSVVAVKAVTDSIEHEIKLGRSISSKNESELRIAHESLGRVLAALDQDQEKNSSEAEVKSEIVDEERKAKSVVDDEERIADLSVRSLALEIQLYSHNSGGKG